MYWLLHKLGFNRITSRSRHPKQSVEVQETFKKLLNKVTDILPVYIPFYRVDIWFQNVMVQVGIQRILQQSVDSKIAPYSHELNPIEPVYNSYPSTIS
jgi:hypothetical protein